MSWILVESECASMLMDFWLGKICQEQAKLHDLQEEAKKREEQIISDLEAVSASMYRNLAL